MAGNAIQWNDQNGSNLISIFCRLDTVELLVRTDPSLMQCLRRAAPDIVYPHTPLHLASRNGHR